MKLKQFVVNYFGVNAYVVSNDAKDAILIDPSVCVPREQKELTDYIASEGLTVRRVLNTHLHLDHVLGNAFVERTFNVKAEAHEEDAFLLDLQEEQSQMFGIPCPDPASPLGNYLAEGDTVEIPDIKLHVFHIAGHSPGGLAFYCENFTSGAVSTTDFTRSTARDAVSTPGNCPILFSGDSLFAGTIGRADLFGGDEDALIANIKNKLLTLPPETIVYPGHGDSTTIAKERENF